MDAEGTACLEGSTTVDEQQGQMCFVIGAILNVILKRLNTVLLVELTATDTKMTAAEKSTLHIRVLKQMNVHFESPEAQESRFSLLDAKERTRGALIRPNKAFNRIVTNFLLLHVLPMFSNPVVCICYGSDLSNMLRTISCEMGYEKQLYELFFETIMGASQEEPKIDLEMERSKLDEIIDNLVDTYVNYMLKVVVNESILQLMAALLANENTALRTLSFRQEVLTRIVDLVEKAIEEDVNK